MLNGRISLARLDAHVRVLAREQTLVASESNAGTKKLKAGPATAPEGNKKRKKESKGSHGVERLKKANVSGMSKLSSFFIKKEE